MEEEKVMGRPMDTGHLLGRFQVAYRHRSNHTYHFHKIAFAGGPKEGRPGLRLGILALLCWIGGGRILGLVIPNLVAFRFHILES